MKKKIQVKVKQYIYNCCHVCESDKCKIYLINWKIMLGNAND